MKYMNLPNTDLRVSRLALGCMRIGQKSMEEVEALIQTALEEGINFFDHADIYGGGESERLYGSVLKQNPGLREKMVIQSKCDIIPKQAGGPRYDTSKDHILSSVDKSLQRLQCGYLDVLLLHRPDPLMDPEEVADAFETLHQAGKVRYFGVSNWAPGKMALLQNAVKQPLVVNQMQLSLVHSCLLDAEIFVDMMEDQAVDRDGGVIDYCMLHHVALQTWCPLQASWAEGSFIDHPKYAGLNQILENIGKKYGATKAAVALGWILRHPAEMQVVVGTTSPQHLKESCKATEFELTRQEWYDLYLGTGKALP